MTVNGGGRMGGWQQSISNGEKKDFTKAFFSLSLILCCHSPCHSDRAVNALDGRACLVAVKAPTP